jgi:hypothetical protein
LWLLTTACTGELSNTAPCKCAPPDAAGTTNGETYDSTCGPACYKYGCEWISDGAGGWTIAYLPCTNGGTQPDCGCAEPPYASTGTNPMHRALTLCTTTTAAP